MRSFFCENTSIDVFICKRKGGATLLDERYLLLFERFGKDTELGDPVEVKLEQLSEVLYCTPRNAKLILKKLQSEQLIDWSPGLGRGNQSKIAFKVDKEAYLIEFSQSLAEQGNYKRAFDLIGVHATGTFAKSKFLEWLDKQFGYKKEEAGEGQHPQDTLMFPVSKPPLTLDPAELLVSFDSHLIRQIFDRLLRFDVQQGSIMPMLAHAWSSNDSATEWTFHLRKGVRFHNGQELTSRDVQFTLERLQNGTANSWLMRGVASIETMGPRAIRVKLSRPNRFFDRFMCSAAASILPHGFTGMEEADYWELPLGTGAFRLISWTTGRMELAAFDAYFQGRPYLDRVDIVILPGDCALDIDENAKVHHSLDTMRLYPHSQEEAWQEIEKLCQGCALLTWNVSREGPQQSEALRRAVKMMLHPGEMVEELGGERVLPAFGFRPETSRSHTVEPIRPERIRRALEESGYAGEILRIACHPKYNEDGLWIMNRLTEWGISTEAVDYEFWSDADFCISGLVFPEDEVCEIEAYQHRDCIMHSYFDEERKQWITGRIDEAVAAESADRRRKYLKEIEDHVRDEATVIFLHHRRVSTLMHPSVRGVSLNSLGWIDFQNVWLE
ncbi:SgrR family transcriptional regulator [Paenibacillus sp. P96]|uniref:SgrR family transcriptional regulator n=1 Tax=Paenibacillus zeirhizosphaerae TaxID=2987519 RepID=A0ABT9FTA1_9BACL|nr:SgrR family transcriptional regulator [Paenibacillus sp. P96]MDP4097964.1 SgrR family transcriptional regulator [Paenibacillus sp. P96]